MNDQDIQVFITGIRRYFECLKKDLRVVIEPPFIKNEEKPFLEYTGIIGVSGKAHGAVCFTANRVMLENILRFLNEAPINGELICLALLFASLAQAWSNSSLMQRVQVAQQQTQQLQDQNDYLTKQARYYKN